jgi:hypothetical protein
MEDDDYEDDNEMNYPHDEDDDDIDYCDHRDSLDDVYDSEFADPGGNSALRAATRTNPRNLPCPECESPNRLTPKDVALGYRCDRCADRAERGGY